jgi:CheY-like chemotaxis protein
MMPALTVKNIMIIDDDQDDCYLFCGAVSDISQTLSVKCADNFSEAESLLEKQTPDLIFLDLNMPFKNGFEVLTELKRHEALKTIPVIIYSSSSYSKDVQLAYEKGAALYLTKPSNFDELLEALKEILARDWSKAAEITAMHVSDGTYRSFSLKPA